MVHNKHSFAFAILLLMPGCAGLPKILTWSQGEPVGLQVEESDEGQLLREQVVRARVLPEGTMVNGVELTHREFDIPIAINSAVEQWVTYFTGRGRDVFTKYLQRGEFFIPYIRPVLQEEGLPGDLVYLSMIESGFSNHAKSRVEAVGPWQFMGPTGKRYGLRQNWWIDERRNIVKSTRAASRYLLDLFDMFGRWELAAAAYNAGEAKMGRAIQRYGSRNFWTLSRQQFLHPETRNYIPKMMAAAIVSKNRVAFGFQSSYLTEEERHKLSLREVDQEIHSKDLAAYDNSYRDEDAGGARTLADSDHPLLGPVEPQEGEVLAGTPRSASWVDTPLPTVDKEGQVTGALVGLFRVVGPADLLKISDAAGVSYEEVKALNPEIRRWCTPPTEGSYPIYLPLRVRDRFLATYNHPAYPREVRFREYKMRNGDTINGVARHFGLEVESIREVNGLRSWEGVRSGQRILIPIPVDHTRSIASLDVVEPPRTRKRRTQARRDIVQRVRTHSASPRR